MDDAEFAADLAGRVRRPVLDRTEIHGRFDIELVVEREQEVFTPLREQLGLRLVSANAPLELLVVETIHLPTPD